MCLDHMYSNSIFLLSTTKPASRPCQNVPFLHFLSLNFWKQPTEFSCCCLLECWLIFSVCSCAGKQSCSDFVSTKAMACPEDSMSQLFLPIFHFYIFPTFSVMFLEPWCGGVVVVVCLCVCARARSRWALWSIWVPSLTDDHYSQKLLWLRLRMSLFYG